MQNFEGKKQQIIVDIFVPIVSLSSSVDGRPEHTLLKRDMFPMSSKAKVEFQVL